MKANRLLLKVYGECHDGQWSLICLDFSLAAQAASLEEAKASLASQIREYVYDALQGQDQEHAYSLLNRRAPIKYWAKWYYAQTRKALHTKLKNVRVICQPLPLVPA